MDQPQIVILGGGPAGLGAAYRLAQRGGFGVTLLEAQERVGGNAASFELNGVYVDYGSHRLHPSTAPAILADIRRLLGGELLDRPRHGRIRLRGRWIHFPLKPLDLALRLPPAFAAGVVGDMAAKVGRMVAPGAAPQDETFATIMERGLGRTICRDFYFPYARKLWGIAPELLSPVQAQRRVKNSSLGKMVGKVLSALPGLKPKGAGRFFYPRRGFGQISQAYAEAARSGGANLVLGARVRSVSAIAGGNGARMRVEYDLAGQSHTVEAGQVWSTLPVTLLGRMLQPPPPGEILQAAGQIDFRAMILIYLTLDTPQFSEYDAHYFPEAHIRISRLSEPKNYSASSRPAGQTVLCAELPLATSDPEWSMSDAELGRLMTEALASAGLPVTAAVVDVQTRRLRNAYPIYQRGFEAPFVALDEWLDGVDNLLTFGRQGLFAHDNTHHALYMAYCAVECLDKAGNFDRARWHEYRRIFETHVVED